MDRETQVTPAPPTLSVVDDSQPIPTAPLPPASWPTVDNVVFKVIATIVLLGAALGVMSNRVEAAVDRSMDAHKEHPHKGAATTKDLERLEGKVDKILEAVK